MAVSWRDALKKAAAPPAPPARPAPVDPGTVSPALQALLDERRRMEATMADLTGQPGASDPRFAVAPLAQRRAELARWATTRDTARPAAPPRAPERQRPAPRAGEPDPMPADRTAATRGTADPLPAERRPAPDRPAADRPTADRLGADRSVAGRMLAALAGPALRDTPGASPGGTAASADAFAALRDAARVAPFRDPSGFTTRAFDRITDVVARPRKAEEALDRARKAIGDDWQGRARRLVPDLVRELPFSPRVKDALKVAVGSVDDLTDRAERLRDTLRDARELKAADEAGDDRRRDRALERLKARRQEDS